MQEIFQKILPQLEKLSEEILNIYENEEVEEHTKRDDTPVTRADLFANEEILKILKPFGYEVLSEESAHTIDRKKEKIFWCVDPIDGTSDFIKKTGDFGIMIGLVENGEPILGIVILPAHKKMYTAQKGAGAFIQELPSKNKEPRKIQVSQTSQLQGASILGSASHFTPEVRELADKYQMQLQKRGSCGLKIVHIAQGFSDLFFNQAQNRMGLWDVCAPQIILEEAGGLLTDCKGEKIDYTQENVKISFGVAASTVKLQKELITFTKNIYDTKSTRT